MSHAPSASFARNSRLTMCVVSAAAGRWNVKMSQVAASSSRSATSSIPSSSMRRVCSVERFVRATPFTRSCIAAARSATDRPICPRPTIPRLRPARPRAFAYRFLSHLPARRSATLSAMDLSIARISAIVSSATATAFFPGTLDTYMPRAAAAATSIVFVPAPARMTSETRTSPSNASAVTSVPRTTTMSWSAIAVGSSAVVRLGFTVQEWPIASICAT